MPRRWTQTNGPGAMRWTVTKPHLPSDRPHTSACLPAIRRHGHTNRRNGGTTMTEQIVAEARALPEAMAGTCRLYPVRHGPTTLNVENRYRGRRAIPPAARCYQDAVDAAHRLSGEGVAA